MTDNQDTWPAGATWVFQGTVAEDGTGGTHVCTLTVTPGAGNEFEVLYGGIAVGATATSQTVQVIVDDGTNVLVRAMNTATTTTGAEFWFPMEVAEVAAGNRAVGGKQGWIVSGTMRLTLKVSTAAISVTQAFSLVCRIKGAMPTAALADTVGTPVLTVNTNKVF